MTSSSVQDAMYVVNQSVSLKKTDFGIVINAENDKKYAVQSQQTSWIVVNLVRV